MSSLSWGKEEIQMRFIRFQVNMYNELRAREKQNLINNGDLTTDEGRDLIQLDELDEHVENMSV